MMAEAYFGAPRGRRGARQLWVCPQLNHGDTIVVCAARKPPSFMQREQLQPWQGRSRVHLRPLAGGGGW